MGTFVWTLIVAAGSFGAGLYLHDAVKAKWDAAKAKLDKLGRGF